MKDYNGYDRIEDFTKYSKNILMQNQLLHEGVDILINNTPTKGIIRNNQNPMSETKEDRSFIVDINTVVQRGSYINHEGINYIVITGIDNYKDYYKECKIRECNQILKWKDANGIIREYPCIISNDSYGSKQNLSNEYISENDSKMDIEVQENIYTKQIKKDTRFMFNNSEDDIFKSTDKTTSVTKGIITITSKKCLPVDEDDFENNLAFNGTSGETPITPTTYSIVGLSDIPYMTTSTYSLSPIDTNVIFSVDDTNICEIQSQSNGQCTLYAKVRDELVTLTATLNGVKVAEKIITTSR